MGNQKQYTDRVAITRVTPNPENPRVIHDDKFAKLVASIREFPAMLELRPIVVNADMVVLGGNMRLRACEAAGLTHVPILRADTLTPDEQRRFIIADNVGYGEWDWDALANQWDAADLAAWGLDIPGDDHAFTEPVEVPVGDIDYKIVVRCDNAEHQVRVVHQLESLGLSCQLLAL